MEARCIPLNELRLVEKANMDFEYDFLSLYLKLRRDYPDYSPVDILMLCKLDRMHDRRLITTEEYVHLLEVLDSRVMYENDYWDVYGEDYKKECELENRLNTLDKELNRYGLKPVDFNSFIDSTIDTRKIKRVHEQNEQGHVKKIGTMPQNNI